MKKTKLQRLISLLLCLTFVIGSFTVAVSAADDASDDSSSNVGSSNDDIYDFTQALELLGLKSYNDYAAENVGVPVGNKTIVIDAVNAIDTEQSKGMYTIGEYAGVNAVYTTGSGAAVWKVNVPERSKYTITVVYYAHVNEGEETKADTIERIFKINGRVPFAESHQITIKKNWNNDYSDATYIGKEDVNIVLAEGKKAGLKGSIIDGKLKFEYPENGVWTSAISAFCDKYCIRFMRLDINNNEIRPAAFQNPSWSSYTFKDAEGYRTEPFTFVFEKGENTISLESKNANMAISHIILSPAEKTITYKDYEAKYEGVKPGKGTIKIEAEYTNSASDKTIYPLEDSADCLASPADPSRVVLNTMGGEKWQTSGQFVTYRFTVDESGMYDIVTKYLQNVLDGMFVNRALYIYSEGADEGSLGYYNGLPFAEAGNLTYNYGDEWQATKATADGDGKKTFSFYFEKGVVYTIRFEVTLGAMSEIINTVQSALDSINADYLDIIQLTGSTPDTYRDYGFSRIMPDVLIDMVRQAKILDNQEAKDESEWGVAQKLTHLAGQKSSNVATLQKISDILLEMGRDEDEIARLLERLKSYIGTLGTFLTDAKTQPLQVDYILIQPADSKMPEVKANFFQGLVHEVKRFVYSFVRNYDNIGTMVETDEESLEVWLATGRDQSQIKRSLVNNDFTPNTGIPVDLKLVAGGTLLPSILAQKGPDVYLGLGQSDVINYAIRSAILPVDGFKDFNEVKNSFLESAMLVLRMDNSEGEIHYYGLPESQGFAMMFVRVDILADIGINEIPKTWDDIMAIIPRLQANNMEIGLSTDNTIHLYQMGGELFADNGMRINLDSQVGLASFRKTCELFTKYSFPYSYNGANRFRTGEMPIIISDYTSLYNQLKVFATEIEGSWVMVPVPGVKQADGSINNLAISAVTASVLVQGSKNQDEAWEYIKWFTGDDCQTEYANEMVALLGPSAKYNTANIAALERLPWTAEELAGIRAQFNNLASVPNYPGSYIISRYTEFAFLEAYNSKADPTQAILGYIYNINKEITRKREEFGLETLELGQTLADKRLGQAQDAAAELEKNNSSYKGIGKEIENAIKYRDIATLNAISKEIMAKTDASSAIKIHKITDITKLTEKQLLYYLATALSDAADALSKY